jgi:virginiamycin B lyase
VTARKTKSEHSNRAPLAGRAVLHAPSIRHIPLLLAMLLALTLALASRAEAYVYWDNGDSIGRANLDGTGMKRNFIPTPGEFDCGLAVDESHVYWGNSVDGTIGRANLDGTGVDEGYIADTNPSPACGVALDGAHVYWANDAGVASGTGTIGRANLDGTGVDESFITDVTFPSGMAVNATHIYWASLPVPPPPSHRELGTIGRANLDGTGVDKSFIAETAYGVAVDAAHIYWASALTDRGTGESVIGRANLDGTGVEVFITGANGPCGVAVTDTHVYWANFNTIGRANLDGGRANHEFTTGIEPRACGGVAVDELPFSFGELKRNRRRGTATLGVDVPDPGQLELAKTKKVKPAEKRANAEGGVKLPVKARAKAKKRLARRGKAKVKAKVSFAPDDGEVATLTKPLKLIKRR